MTGAERIAAERPMTVVLPDGPGFYERLDLEAAAAATRHQIDGEIDWGENVDYEAVARRIIAAALVGVVPAEFENCIQDLPGTERRHVDVYDVDSPPHRRFVSEWVNVEEEGT